MRVTVSTVDDALQHSLQALITSGTKIDSSRGRNTEIIGAQIEITNPLARISRTETRSTLHTALGECLWYLAGSDSLDFISYYAPNYESYVEVKNGSVVGGYGPRLFNYRGVDQLKQTIELLNHRPSSKKAVIQLFDCADLAASTREVPCTCTIQFICRDNKLHAITTMRSNDVIIGMPHDVFAFTMLQELVARSIGKELGTYRHWVGSLHYYEKDYKKVQDYLNEGWQQTIGMQPMPAGDPWPQIETILKAEQAYRIDDLSDPWPETGEAYWDQMIWLLEMRRHLKRKDAKRAAESWKQRKSRGFDFFLRPSVDKLAGADI